MLILGTGNTVRDIKRFMRGREEESTLRIFNIPERKSGKTAQEPGRGRELSTTGEQGEEEEHSAHLPQLFKDGRRKGGFCAEWLSLRVYRRVSPCAIRSLSGMSGREESTLRREA